MTDEKRAEYNELCQKAGEIQYSVMLQKAMLDQINQKIFELVKTPDNDPAAPIVFRPNIVSEVR